MPRGARENFTLESERMTGPRVLLGPERTNRDPRPLESGAGLGALVVMAVALLLVGATDLALAMYPPSFGNAEWRFTVLAAVANGLPMVTVGALVLLVAAVFQDSPGGLRAAVVLNGLLVVLILVAAVGFLTSIGVAFEKTPAEVHPGLRKAVAKSVVIFAAFGVAHGAAAVAGARALQRGRDL